MKKLTLLEKLSYGLGDTASNIVFQVVINFILFFYTDIYGISAAAAGTLMLVVRIFDAVTDPIVGAIADRTNSKLGKYRPYLLYASIPYGLLAVFAFTTPDFGESGKLIYAYITYAALMTIYTVINIPYSALGGVLTTDPSERASLQSYRFAMAMVGGTIVTGLTMPLVTALGGDDAAKGFQLTMGVFALIAVSCFLLCFYFTRERETSVSQPSTDSHSASASFREEITALFTNSQWLIIAGVAFITLVLVAARGATVPYYVKYYLAREDLVSAFMTAGMVAAVAGALATHFLTQKIDKVRLFYIANIGLLVFHALLYWIPKEAIILAFISFALANFFQLIVVPLMFSMVPDTADFDAIRTGKQRMAMCFSGHLWAIKMGLAVGGAMAGWLLDGFGYTANTEQSAATLTGILVVVGLVPGACALMNMAIFIPYRLTNSRMQTLQQQLAKVY